MDTVDFSVPACAQPGAGGNDAARGQKLEIKTYESFYDARGRKVTLDLGLRKQQTESPDTNNETAIVIVMDYDVQKRLVSTEMQIRSPYIRNALKQVIRAYPGVAFNTKQVIIRGEPKHFPLSERATRSWTWIAGSNGSATSPAAVELYVRNVCPAVANVLRPHGVTGSLSRDRI